MKPLPKAVWLACKGTIASQATSGLEVVNYGSAPPDGLPKLTGREILARIPDLKKLVDLEILDFTNDEDTATALKYARIIEALDPEMPVVLSHGTNVMPEVAFLLDLVLDRPAPVVVTGSMRPISSISSDAEYNLVQAFGLATDPSAHNRGVMIVLNDRIGSAYYTTKVSANRMDTFRAIEQGQLGIFNNYTPYFFFPPARPTHWQHFDVSGLKELPKVDNFYLYTDVDASDFDHFIGKPGLQGIGIAGFGAADAAGFADRLVELGASGFPIVRTSVHADSYIAAGPRFEHHVAAGHLGPAKSKILLQVAIAKYGCDITQIRKAFGTDREPRTLTH